MNDMASGFLYGLITTIPLIYILCNHAFKTGIRQGMRKGIEEGVEMFMHKNIEKIIAVKIGDSDEADKSPNDGTKVRIIRNIDEIKDLFK